MTVPREAVHSPADSGRSPNPTTEEIETFWHGGADALRPSALNEQLRASIATFPPSLRRMVDDEPPATIAAPPICEYCGPICYHGAAHNARVEAGDRWSDDLSGIEIEIPPAGVVALAELAAENQTETKRERLMTSLLFAARNLAERFIVSSHRPDGRVFACASCGAEVDSNPLRNADVHDRGCDAGLVLVILAELAKLPPTAESDRAHRFCPKCGLFDGAWVAENPAGASPSYTHLCPDVAGNGGAA